MHAILGLSAFHHDSAAALVLDGRIAAAAQEERFSRRARDAAFPRRAAAYCLHHAGLQPRDLDAVVFHEQPLARFDRVLETYLALAPRGLRSFLAAMPQWLRHRLHLPRAVRRGLPGRYRGPILFTDRPEAHAASAFFPSPFEEAAILTLDGPGEWATATFGVGRGARLELLEELRFPHSLGLLYAAFASYAGLGGDGAADELMGLAPYGQPVYRDVILRHLLDLKADGSFRLHLDYFRPGGPVRTTPAFHALFGGPPRSPKAPLRQRDMDVAASVQAVTEEVVLRMAHHVHARTGMPNLVMAGSAALNGAVNGRLLREGPFRRIWVQPAAGDAGGALGAALFAHHQLLGRPRRVEPDDAQQGSLLGPAFTAGDVATFLRGAEAVARAWTDEADLLEAAAELLASGKVLGWFHGRMEFGPRALGARTILADPRGGHPQGTDPFREGFRPFGACVLEEHARDYFDLPLGAGSPYMLCTFPVAQRQRVPCHDAGLWECEGLDRLRVPRSTIPAVTHVDGSARVQTVDARRHGRFHRLLQAFHRRTGCPVLAMASFHAPAEPIVCTPAEAYRCFLHTDLDALVLEDHLLLKHEQAPCPAPQRAVSRVELVLD